MNNSSLVKLLSVFSKAREQIVSEFLEHDPEIYGAIFRYENDEKMMRLLMERHILAWISCHFMHFHNKFESPSEELGLLFKSKVLALMEDFVLGQQPGARKSERSVIFYELLAEKQNILDALINFSNRDDANYKKLIYSREKDKALFERQFAKLKGN